MWEGISGRGQVGGERYKWTDGRGQVLLFTHSPSLIHSPECLQVGNDAALLEVVSDNSRPG